MKYFCCVLRRHLVKKFKDVNSILECYNLFSGVELSMRSFFVVQMHCSTLFLVGSQFILKNSFVPMWALLSRFKQYLMHLFWAICILFDCRLFSKGYHAAQA